MPASAGEIARETVQPRLPGSRRLVAVIPAHNEEDEIGQTLAALTRQVPAECVTVAADNCTDRTVEIARARGANVIETVGNTDKKAGALNQALARLLPTLEDEDGVLVLDADTEMADDFVVAALAALDDDADRGAVGGIFLGRGARSPLEQCQANEYARYGREIERTRRVMVLTGTASIIRVQALREVAAARGTSLPGAPGDVYDRTALTEDMELTLALQSLGWSLASPQECLTSTQLMPTVRALMQQRERWYRGALENLRTYGATSVTRRYIFQQVMLALGTLAMSLYLLLLLVDAITGQLGLNPFWLSVGVLFTVERVVTAWRAGPAGRLLALLTVPELVYDVLLQAAFVKAVLASVRGSEQTWHHNTAVPARG